MLSQTIGMAQGLPGDPDLRLSHLLWPQMYLTRNVRVKNPGTIWEESNPTPDRGNVSVLTCASPAPTGTLSPTSSFSSIAKLAENSPLSPETCSDTVDASFSRCHTSKGSLYEQKTKKLPGALRSDNPLLFSPICHSVFSKGNI